MSIALAKGVQLHVIPTNKYKTIRVMIRFSAPVAKGVSSKRTLLGSLLETNSLNYPTQTVLSEKLADLYGASFGINIGKKGNSHYITVMLNVVNDKFLPNKDKVLTEGIAFLKEILFYPHIKENKFDEETFDLEKNNLKEYIASVYDDKQSQAALALQSLYFDSDNQKVPSFGDVEEVEQETATSMAEYYQHVMNEDEIDIIVLGDVEEATIVPLFQDFPFEDRAEVSQIFYTQAKKEMIQEKTEILPVAQGKLNLAFQTNIYFHDVLYFPLQIFNGLFGGFPHSKLFMNVREKESMAYYASSSIDTFRGYLTVQSGIDSKNKDRVLTLVKEQLESLRKGEISAEELAQTKEMLKNQYLLSLDNAAAVVEAAYTVSKFKQAQLSDEEWLKNIENVTVEDVQKVASQVELQSIYFMEGAQN